MNPDDARVVAALLAGDEQAFDALAASLRRPMRSLVRRFVDEFAIDDVVQQTWLEVLEGLTRFEGRSRLSTWVLQVALHLARASNRKASREAPWPDEELPPDARFSALGQWSSPPLPWRIDGTTPEQLAANRELVRVLEASLPRLPEAQRVAVTLRDVEGLELAEVAAVLEVNEGHARVLLHRGRSRLRDALELALGTAVTPVTRGTPTERRS